MRSAAMRGRGRALATALRRAGAGERVLPDFLIIGAQKAGTTSLYAYLGAHPSILSAARKEVHYFDLNHERGEGWYRSMFPSRERVEALVARTGSSVAVGEASPYYLFHPLAAGRAAQLLPEVRLLVLLRDPVERAWSHYRHEVAAGRETLDFAAALDAEPDRLAGAGAALAAGGAGAAGQAHRTAAYVGRGRYAEQLTRWLAHYPRESLLVRTAEEFFARPATHYRQVLQFLGVPDTFAPQFAVHNSGDAATMDHALEKRLATTFAEPNAALEQLLGRTMEWTHH